MSFLPVSDPVLIFSIVMVVVLIAPLIAEKLRLPGIIALIFFGIILGPHVGNVLERDKTIELLGMIGLLHIMFIAGIEVDLQEIKSSKHLSISFGLITFTVPFFTGFIAAYFLLKMNLYASLLLASMFSSHSLLTFPIVSKLGLTKKPAVTATIGGTIITDIMALFALAIIVAMDAGEVSVIFWIKLLSLSILYSAGIVFLLPKLTSWFFKSFYSDSGAEDYVFVTTALFVSSYLSKLIGLEPIIGAFITGLTLNPLIPEKSILMTRIKFVANSLFIPFFLISVGMIINPILVFTDLNTILVSITMFVVIFVGKFLSAFVFGKAFKFSGNDIGLIFGISINQASATLAAGLVGYNVGILNEAVLSGTILMIAVTTFLGSIMTQKYSLKIKKHDVENKTLVKPETVERILVPLSNPNNLNSLMDLAFLLDKKNASEPIYPLHIALNNDNVGQNIIAGEELLAKAGERAYAMQKSILPLTKVANNVLSAILKTVAEQRISKIVLGVSPKSKFIGTFLINVSEELIKHCNEMIFISRNQKPFHVMKRIVLIVPPHLYKQNGFLNTFQVLKNLGNQLSTQWLIVCEEESFADIKVIFDKEKIAAEHYLVQNWKNITKELAPVVKEDDLIIPMLARRGHLSWRVQFEQMPTALYKSFSENNIILVYPLHLQEDDESYKQDIAKMKFEDLKLLELVPEDNYFFNCKNKDFIASFEQALIAKNIHYKNKITQEIKNVIESYPIELSKKLVLVHTQTEYVKEQNILIFVNKNGFLIERFPELHQIVLVFLSPKTFSTEKHLNMLSQVSRMVLIENYIETLVEEKDYNRFIRKIKTIIKSK